MSALAHFFFDVAVQSSLLGDVEGDTVMPFADSILGNLMMSVMVITLGVVNVSVTVPKPLKGDSEFVYFIP